MTATLVRDRIANDGCGDGVNDLPVARIRIATCPEMANSAMKVGWIASVGSRTEGDGVSLHPFLRGFLALLPLWIGAIPVGVAYGLAARNAGLSFGEAQLMSLTVVSAAAQVSAVTLIEAETSLLVIVGTAVALNVQLLLLGLAVGRACCPTGAMRWVTAYFLTDGAYGVAATGGRFSVSGLLGAGVSMFLAWNLGSAIGAGVGTELIDPRRLGVGIVAPLMFLAVLVPLLRTRASLLTAAVAGIATLILMRLTTVGIAVLGAGLAGSVAGALLAERTEGGARGRGGAEG